MNRLLMVAAGLAAIYVLTRTSVTVPAISLVALAVWAMFATVAACLRRPVRREQLRRYRSVPVGGAR